MKQIRQQTKHLPLSKKALVIARHAHEGQVRKGTTKPYIIHPYSVYGNLRPYTTDEVTLAAALLHDVLEDVHPSKYSEQDMHEDFGLDVVSVVRLVTKDFRIKQWRASNEAYLKTLEAGNDERALLVSASDKLDNLSTSLHDYARQGEQFWSRFNAGKEDQKWFYTSVHRLLDAKIPHHPIVAIYGAKVEQLNKL